MTYDRRNVEFEVPYSKIDADLWAELRDAQKVAATLKEKLRQKYASSDEYRAALAVAGIGSHTGTKLTPHIRICDHSITCSVPLDLERPEGASAPLAHSLSLDTALLNTLLHGKLLSDEEKRGLLTRILPSGVLHEPVKGAAE